MKLYKYIISSTLLMSGILSGCSDFLDTKSDTQSEVDYTFTSYEELRKSTGFLYAMPWYLFNASNIWVLGDARANNYCGAGADGPIYDIAAFSERSENMRLSEAWKSLYNVVANADYVINKYSPIAIENGVNIDKVNECKAEARFMRGLAYWYLSLYWRDVPVIEDPENHSVNYTIKPTCFEDVLEYAIADMEYAADSLPLSDVTGRVTRYSAKGMLGRFYVTAGSYAAGNHFTNDYLTIYGKADNYDMSEYFFEKAKTVCEDVIENSRFRLMSDYEDLFKIKHNNNSESLFSLQWVPGSDTWGLGNINQNNLAYDRYLVGDLPAWGLGAFASYDFVKLSLKHGGLSRTRGNVFADNQQYDYLGGTYAGYWRVGYFKGDTTLTKTMVREWNIKKFVVGSDKDTDGIAIDGNSGLATPMLRLAEVYLLYVEACIGSQDKTTDAKALNYMSEIRERAWKHELEGKSPLQYPYTNVSEITREDLFIENRMEFFMEGLFWSQIVRRSYIDMNWVVSYLNNEMKFDNEYMGNHRWWNYVCNYDKSSIGAFSKSSPESSTGSETVSKIKHVFDSASDYVHSPSADARIWALPYPTKDLSINPNLSAKPVNHNFKQRENL